MERAAAVKRCLEACRNRSGLRTRFFSSIIDYSISDISFPLQTPLSIFDRETKGGVWPADVATSGHVNVLKFEERPAGRSGVVKEVRGIVLVVRSGNGQETWNVTPETMLTGIERGQFQPGDEISAKLYKNHNLAEIVLIKRGVKVN